MRPAPARMSHRSRGRTLRGWAGGSTLVIAIGTIASASSAAGDREGRKAARPKRLERHLAARGGAKLAIW